MDTSRLAERVRALIAEQALVRLDWERTGPMEDDPAWEKLEREAAMVSSWLSELYREGAWRRSVDLSLWRQAEAMAAGVDGWAGLTAAAGAWRDGWRIRRPKEDPAAEEAAELEVEALERAFSDGHYERSHPWTAEMDDWLFIRLGPPPKSGLSRFGLAGPDTEDHRDEWAVELGREVEAGICVLRARRHPDVAGGYILLEPDFERALYRPPPFPEYLASIAPQGDFPVLLVAGSVASFSGPDRRRHANLGSDGEFLIDPGKPWSTSPIDPAMVFADSETPLLNLLTARRGGPTPF